MTVLITGATGFVGGRLAKEILASGLAVRLLVRSPEKAASLEYLGAKIIQGDLYDIESLQRATDGIECVYHIAGQMIKEGLARDDYLQTNLIGTRNIVQVSLDENVRRFVYASTAGVYGHLKEPVDENSPLSLSSGYRESKALGERVCLDAHREHGLPAVIARLSPMMGPESKQYLGLVRALKSKNFRIIGDGENYDHISPIQDIINGLILCGTTSGIEGETFIIASDTQIKIKSILAKMACAAGAEFPQRTLPSWPYILYTKLGEALYLKFGKELPYVYRYAFFLANKRLINNKAKERLGFSPCNDITDIINETVSQFRSENLV